MAYPILLHNLFQDAPTVEASGCIVRTVMFKESIARAEYCWFVFRRFYPSLFAFM